MCVCVCVCVCVYACVCVCVCVRVCVCVVYLLCILEQAFLQVRASVRAGGGEESKQRTQNQYISFLHTHTHTQNQYISTLHTHTLRISI